MTLASTRPRRRQRHVAIGLVSILVATLSACTGRGGGQLPPDGLLFAGAASFGFSFSCERSSKSTRPQPSAGRLRIQLSYTDHGRNLLGSGFSVHGTVDTLDPVLESMICIGQEPPPGGNELIFLGRYRSSGPAPAGFAPACTTSGSLCRFEVVVRDNDSDRAPSAGDFFSIKLSSGTALSSELDPATVFYARAGLLRSGNLTVD
ncbi:hypothetical protein [Nocardioides xinjiangensis]|uniref:hypothetical protein n=1 Tax=Nocardioides xinjiangensis TaxID=2817376 RepID=UPI001B30DB43|nr:hypothetical protein [Nocardioides sp. SYSU D00778]